MKKRLCGVAMALCVLLTLIPPGAFAADSDVYAILYTDGVMAFQRGSTPKRSKAVSKTYPVDLTEEYEWDSYNGRPSTPWYEVTDSIRVVDFADAIRPGSLATWFYGCGLLERIDHIRNLDTSDVTSMWAMFEYCGSLTELDLSTFDTSNVTNMCAMFYGLGRLEELDVSGFDTSHVTNMLSMFVECKSLTELDLSSFDTSRVKDMGSMFSGCVGLTALDLSGFKTSKVTNMSSMFSRCAGLTALDLSGFDTSKVTGIGGMFSGCTGLTALDLSGFDTSKVTRMGAMFSECANLQTIRVSDKFTTASVQYGGNMFDGCASLVGGAGTKYDSEHTDAAYARIDGGASAPGYFTPEDAPAFVVAFNANGGSVSQSSKEVMNGATYGELPAPVRAGYLFDGWFDAIDGGTQVTAETTVNLSGNQELFALWTPIRYTVTFNANGGSVSPPNKEVTNGGSYGELPTPVRTGYAFDGWFTAADGGAQVTPETAVSLTGNRVLYAHWTATRCVVTFDANGGSVSPSSKEVVNGGTYGELPAPVRNGYVFDGWYTAVEGGTQVTAVNAVRLSDHQTLYAHWRKDAITYSVENANGEASAVTDISEVAPGSELTVKVEQEAPSDEFRTASVFCAVYDRGGMMVHLQVWDMDVSDPLNIAMSGNIRIPENVSVGEIRVFVLSENLVPLRAPGILG